MERVGGREEKMEGHCSTGQSPQWAVLPMEEEVSVQGRDLETVTCVHCGTHQTCRALIVEFPHTYVAFLTASAT